MNHKQAALIQWIAPCHYDASDCQKVQKSLNGLAPRRWNNRSIEFLYKI